MPVNIPLFQDAYSYGDKKRLNYRLTLQINL
jgi:hypothetical protein